MSNTSLAGGKGAREPFSCRLATPKEMPEAAKLILSDANHTASSSQIVEFLNCAPRRAIDLSQTWIAETNGVVLYALLPVRSAGRTLLLLTPVIINDRTAASRTIVAVCERYAGEVQLAQVLLDPELRSTRQLFVEHGFVEMAELIYLQGSVPRQATFPELGPGYGWKTYSSQWHDLFAATILQSYEESLDCPALNGVRGIEDIIEGHKATGQFDPALWQLLCEGDEPRGVLLLSRLPDSDLTELVYLGLSVKARGRGFGDLMLRQALAVASRENRQRLTLAVDAINAPALKLYYRHGMHRVMSKVALIKTLSP